MEMIGSIEMGVSVEMRVYGNEWAYGDKGLWRKMDL